MIGEALVVAVMLFCFSIVGMCVHRKNVIILLMCVELLLLAVNTSFLAFAAHLGDLHGGVFVFFILAVAAAESAIGLAVFVLVFRQQRDITVNTISKLRG